MAKGNSGFDKNGGGSKSEPSYEMRTRGQVTRYEAGILYKAVKNKNVSVLPETTSMLYDEADKQIRFARERYQQDHRFYDRVEKLTDHLLKGEYKKAQKTIDEIEKDLIERSGKRSRYYKYKNKR